MKKILALSLLLASSLSYAAPSDLKLPSPPVAPSKIEQEKFEKDMEIIRKLAQPLPGYHPPFTYKYMLTIEKSDKNGKPLLVSKMSGLGVSIRDTYVTDQKIVSYIEKCETLSSSGEVVCQTKEYRTGTHLHLHFTPKMVGMSKNAYEIDLIVEYADLISLDKDKINEASTSTVQVPKFHNMRKVQGISFDSTMKPIVVETKYSYEGEVEYTFTLNIEKVDSKL